MISERFNLGRNVKFSVIAFLINIGLIFLSYRLVIKYDGVASVGLWSLLMAWANIFRVGDVGMGGAIIRFVSSKNLQFDEGVIREFIDTGLLINILAFGLLMLIGYFFLQQNLFRLIDPSSMEKANELLPLLFSAMFASSVAMLIISSLQGLHYGYLGSYLSMGCSVLQILLVVILVPDIGINGLAWAQLVQYTLLIFLGWFCISLKTSRSHFFPKNFSLAALKKMFSYSLKAQIANISNGLFDPLSKILFSQFGGLQEQGVYELAHKTVTLARSAVISGLSASLPSITDLVKTSPLEALSFYEASHRVVVRSISFVSVAIVLLIPFFSWLWFGRLEADYGVFIIILVIGYWFNVYGAAAYNLGPATGVMRFNILVTVSALGFIFILGGSLGNVIGSAGVVISISSSLIFSSFLLKYFNEKLLLNKISKIKE